MGATQFKGGQILDATVGIADLSATGTPGSTTYLRGDNTWSVPAGGSSSDIALSLLAPLTSQVITAGYSAVVAGRYTIAVATRLTVGLAARFKVI